MKFNNRGIYISKKAIIGENVKIGNYTSIYDNVEIGDNSIISDHCAIGEPTSEYYKNQDKYQNGKTTIGANSLIRSHSIIYSNNTFGNNLATGHRIIIREHCNFGNNCSIGNGTELHGYCNGGDYVRVHSNVDLAHASLGSFVWIYTGARFTNDPQPPSNILKGAFVDDYSIVAVNAIVLSGMKIGKHCLIGAGSLVSRNIPDYSLAMGNPIKIRFDLRQFKDLSLIHI